MTYQAPPAADDPGDDIGAGFAMLRRVQLARLAVIRDHLRRVLIAHGLVALAALLLAVGAAVTAAARSEPRRSIMIFLAAMNGATIIVCIWHCARDLREGLRARADALAVLARIERDACAYRRAVSHDVPERP
jgi:hypothetical protein